MPRRQHISVWTWDYGTVRFDPRAEPVLARRLLQKFWENGMWDEIRKFPPDVLRRHAPRLDAPRYCRRFLTLCARLWSRRRR